MLYLVMDNLSAHCTPEFKRYCKKKCKGLIGYTPKGCTDICQPVDKGIGKGQ